MSITLYIGRHGETDLNSSERLRGWIDEELNAEGIKEAKAMAKKMSTIKLDKIYASDLDRADATADHIAKEQGLAVMAKSWFRPINFGTLNGKKLSDIQDKLDEITEVWKKDPDHEAPGGESFTAFQERNLDGLATVFERAMDKDQIMIVAHLRNFLLFRGVAAEGGPLKGDALEWMTGKRFDPSSGDIGEFEWNGQLRFVGMFKGSAKRSEKEEALS